MIYQSLTGKTWTKTDQAAYEKVKHLSIEQLDQLMRTIHNRSTEVIGSFAYFAKSILAETASGKENRSRAALKKKLEKMVAEVRALHAGTQNYQISDLIYDLKNRCAREGLIWNDDVANELLGL